MKCLLRFQHILLANVSRDYSRIKLLINTLMQKIIVNTCTYYMFMHFVDVIEYLL